MSLPAVRALDLCKQYAIGARGHAPATLYELLGKALGGLRSSLVKHRTSSGENGLFWALQDLTFEIAQGEVIGIVGRNGAGKSTLLKVLSRITAPTSGRVEIRGKLSSLLEVGTGFHPELSGRENIFLNGAILGMGRQEIARKFDEIVAFAEIGKFVDTPVKRYSSGMYVRLAFSVAAHLDPDVLLIDEVLAVGDAAFQKRCLGKMRDVALGGRTVIFVSHNMGAVSQLCSRAILLEGGRCVFQGKTDEAIGRYMSSMDNADSQAVFELSDHKPVQLKSMAITTMAGKITATAPHTSGFLIKLRYEVRSWPAASYVCVEIVNNQDLRIMWSCDVSSVAEIAQERDPGEYEAVISVPAGVLSPGRYSFTAAVYAPGHGTLHDVRDRAVSIDVIDGGSLLSAIGAANPALTMIPLQWQTELVGETV
jgi:lipopolysaccharide transport system ATP-binding protein